MVIARLLATPKYAPCGIQKRDISCHWNVYLVKISLQSLKCYLMWSVFETASLFFRKSAWASWCCRCCDYKMTQYKRLKGHWTKPTPQHNRVIFAWPWDENARTKQKQQTNGSWAIWLIYRMDTNTRGFWLVKRTLGWKNFKPEESSRNQPILRFDVILQHDWPIEQRLLHIRVFFRGKTKRPCFDLFIHWLITQITNTYRKPFFKVIRKSLYLTVSETPRNTQSIRIFAV